MEEKEIKKIMELPEEDRNEVFSYLTGTGPSIALANLHPKTFYLTHCYGGMIPHKEAMEIIEGLTIFYNEVSEEYIENYNKIREVGLDKSIPLQPKNRSGYIYFLEAENGLVKIGMTMSLQERIGSLEYELPVRVRLKYAFKVKDRFKTEKLLHKHFESKRLDPNKEWFQLSRGDHEDFITHNLPQGIKDLIIETVEIEEEK